MYLGFRLSYSPSFRNFTNELFKLTSICRKSYSLTVIECLQCYTGFHMWKCMYMYHSIHHASPKMPFLMLHLQHLQCQLSLFSGNSILKKQTFSPFFMSHYGNVKWPSWRLELPVNQVFKSLFRLTKINIKGPRYCPFVGGIHRRPLDSPQKGTVLRQILAFVDVIMYKWHRSIHRETRSYVVPIPTENKRSFHPRVDVAFLLWQV